jgi:hypothetical protein
MATYRRQQVTDFNLTIVMLFRWNTMRICASFFVCMGVNPSLHHTRSCGVSIVNCRSQLIVGGAEYLFSPFSM